MSQPPHPFLSRLRQQYFSLYPVRLIDFSPPLDSPLLLSLNQEWLIQSLLQVPRAPAWDYQKRFWKGMVEELEKEVRKPEAAESELDLDDRIMEHYSELLVSSLPGNSNEVPSASYKTYIYDHVPVPLGSGSESSNRPESSEKSITLLEAQTTVESGSTGLRTWTASLYLATSFLHGLLSEIVPRPQTNIQAETDTASQRRSSILELGAGTGFLSIFLAQMGVVDRIWSSDIRDEGDQGNVDSDVDSVADGDAQRVVEKGERMETTPGVRRGPFETLKSNLAINRPSFTTDVEAVAVDWTDAIPPPPSPSTSTSTGAHTRYDQLKRFSETLPEDLVIAAADVIYDPELVPPLVACLKLFLESSTTTGTSNSASNVNQRFAIVAATVRNSDTLVTFTDACARSHLHVDQLALPSIQSMSSGRNGDPTFWNASTWEGEDVRVMRITV